VVELQHGFVGPMHLAYNTAPGRRPAGLPDYLLTFGDWWRETTPGLPLPAERAPAIGYGWLERRRQAARGAERDPRRTVLFVSQGTIAAELSRIAEQLAERLDPQAWLVRFKHHPSDVDGWQQRYPQLAASRVQVVDRGAAIYDELARADVQVGVYSTAVFEGLDFGLETYAMTLSGYQALQPLADAGHVTLCDDVDQLLARLLDPAPARPPRADALWRPGAADNFRAFIEGLIGPPR
jgi:hypothetical protein